MTLITCTASPFIILFLAISLIEFLIFEVWLYYSLDKRFKNLIFKVKETEANKLPLWIIVLLIITVPLALVLFAVCIYFNANWLAAGIVLGLMCGMTYMVHNHRKLDPDECKFSFINIRILTLLIIIVCGGHDYWYYKASIILKGNEYSYATFVGADEIKYKYLGFIDGNYFLLDRDSQELVVKYKPESIRLHKFLRKGVSDYPDIYRN